MKRETLIWTVVLLIGAAIFLANGLIRGAGSTYVKVDQQQFVRVIDPAARAENAKPAWMPRAAAEAKGIENLPAEGSDDSISWESRGGATKAEFDAAGGPEQPTNVYPHFEWSLSRTIGTWIAALFTLFIFSFLYRDNPLYKIAESVVVGVSAAYWMVVGFWAVIIPNLVGKIHPPAIEWAMPGLEEDANYWYIVPLILGIMLLWRLAPMAGWISRWPLAFIIGTTAGLRLIAYMQGDFLAQIRNAIIPLWAVDESGSFQFWETLKAFFLIAGVLVCLVYFFFSFEHKGVVGKTARVGIWVLMITFGAGFGYTVMGRIALLAIRIEFLFDDWLWLIDPTGKRLADAAAMLGIM